MPATAPPVPVLPGAEPVDLPGGPVGVLLSHGFTGTTQSVRPVGRAPARRRPDASPPRGCPATAPAGRT